MGEGKKHDEDKLRFDLIPPEAMEALADILTIGAKKYGDRNWEKGMRWGKISAAFGRHLTRWQLGEELDPEDQRPHLDHALCNIVFLVTYAKRGIGTDDRRAVLLENDTKHRCGRCKRSLESCRVYRQTDEYGDICEPCHVKHYLCRQSGCSNRARYSSGFCGVCDIKYGDGKGVREDATTTASGRKTTTESTAATSAAPGTPTADDAHGKARIRSG